MEIQKELMIIIIVEIKSKKKQRKELAKNVWKLNILNIIYSVYAFGSHPQWKENSYQHILAGEGGKLCRN